VSKNRKKRRMLFRPGQAYNGPPLLPPKADVEARAVLKACITARAALSKLKAAGDLIPNQALYEVVKLPEGDAGDWSLRYPVLASVSREGRDLVRGLSGYLRKKRRELRRERA
jgi:hypothetical protein